MRVYEGASSYRVTVSRREVREFQSTWPCHGMRDQSVTFEFSKSNGDLLDHNLHCDTNHSSRAASALADDAMLYGARRLKLATVLTLRAPAP